MKLAIAGAALLIAAAFAGPASAQAVVEDPGYCAQFYPNANCQNYGPGNPVYDPGGYYGRSGWQSGPAPVAPSRRVFHHRRHYR